MAALESMGAVCDLAPGLWLVRTRFSAGVIRNTLSQTLERGDRFVVIDATRDRLAWFNLGPEVDVRIGKVWNGPLRGESIAEATSLIAAWRVRPLSDTDRVHRLRPPPALLRREPLNLEMQMRRGRVAAGRHSRSLALPHVFAFRRPARTHEVRVIIDVPPAASN